MKKLLCITMLLLFISCTSKKQNDVPEVIKEGQVSNFGKFDIVLNSISLSDYVRLGYYQGTKYAGAGNKYLILNITFVNKSNCAESIFLDDLASRVNNKIIHFDENMVIGNYEEKINPETKETINVAYKVPENIDTAILLPNHLVSKSIVMIVPHSTYNGYNNRAESENKKFWGVN